MEEIRLDLFIKEKYNFSREYSKEIILKGYVKIDGKVILKPSFKVFKNSNLELLENAIPKYVSRGGFKLEKALEYFKIDLTDKICLDIGASTGGFSDCMLKNGAKKIYAVDVGTNQLDKSLLNNEKIISMENTDIRKIDKFKEKVDFISVDVSFISLKKITGNFHNFLKEKGQIIALIKPQFEAGKENIDKNGIVKNKKIHKKVLGDLYTFFNEINLKCNGITFSPIKGSKGNIEYLINLTYTENKKNINLDISKIIEEAFEKLK